MSIEAGSPGGVGFVGGAVEAGGFSAPAIGIGAEITALSSPIINEGPVGSNFRLTDTVPLAVNSFSEFNVANAVLEAEEILAQAAKPDIISGVPQVIKPSILHSFIEPNLEESAVKPNIVRQAAYWYADNPQDVKAAEVIMPKTEPVLTPLAVPILGFQEQKQKEETDQLVEEIVIDDQQQILEEDQEDQVIEQFVIKYSVDEEVSEERRLEIRQAIKVAIAEAEKKGLKEIEGSDIVKNLLEHPGVRSQIVKNEGPDGSFEETLQAISSQRFTSEKEAVKRADEIIDQKEPVKRGKFGREVTFEAVARVLKMVFESVPKEPIGAKITNIRKYRISKVNPNRVLTEITQKRSIEPRIEENPDLAAIFGVGLTKHNLQG